MGTTPDATIVAIDIGTKTICVVLGKLDPEGTLTLIGSAAEPSAGLRRGGIVDLEAATATLVAALNKGEAESGRRIDSAYVGLSGLYMQACNLHGSTSILPTGREVQSEDVAHAIAAARAALSDEKPSELVHLIPRGNTLDGQEGIHNPPGMIGREVWVEAHTVTGTSSHIANRVKYLREAHIEPEDLVAGPLAAAEGVIQTYPDESSPPVVDLGAETLSLAIYDDGAIWHSELLPLGSDDLTRDIAIALRLPLETAKAVKCHFGHCYPSAVAEDELVELQPLTQIDELLPRRLLAEILHTRASAFAQTIAERVRDAEEAGIRPSVLVLVGGGAHLSGLASLLKNCSRYRCRLGGPKASPDCRRTSHSHSFASAAGLLLWGARQRQRQMQPQKPGKRASCCHSWWPVHAA